MLMGRRMTLKQQKTARHETADLKMQSPFFTSDAKVKKLKLFSYHQTNIAQQTI